MKFQYKKSSVGEKFVKAFVFGLKEELVMVTGLGNRTTALEQFTAMKKKATTNNGMANEVVVSADDVQIDLD